MEKKLVLGIVIFVAIISIAVFCYVKFVSSKDDGKTSEASSKTRAIDDLLFMSNPPKFQIDEIESQLDLSSDFTYSNYTNLDEGFIVTYYYKKCTMVLFNFDENRSLNSVTISATKETDPDFEKKNQERINLISYLLGKDFCTLSTSDKDYIINYIFEEINQSPFGTSVGNINILGSIINDDDFFGITICIN